MARSFVHSFFRKVLFCSLFVRESAASWYFTHDFGIPFSESSSPVYFSMSSVDVCAMIGFRIKSVKNIVRINRTFFFIELISS